LKLERRFRWDDVESVYKAVDEETCERAPEGRVRFTAIRADGRVFVGVGYPSTVSDMVDAVTGWWKLQANPKSTVEKPKGNVVVEVGAPPLAGKRRVVGRVSGTEPTE